MATLPRGHRAHLNPLPSGLPRELWSPLPEWEYGRRYDFVMLIS